MSQTSSVMWRTLNNRVSGLYQYAQLIFGSSGYQPTQPSDKTIEIAQQLFHLLDQADQFHEPCSNHKHDVPQSNKFDNDGSKLASKSDWLLEVRKLFKACDDLQALLDVSDDAGYSVIQVAVIKSLMCFLCAAVSEGCDLNRSKCSLPLHLACAAGNIQLVSLLLQLGARPDLECGMCYPEPHQPIRHVPSRFHFLETDIFICDDEHQLPLMYAIRGDHVDVVQCLLDQQNQSSAWNSRHPLHYACIQGAHKCILYLLKLRPDAINSLDDAGMTPLLYGLRWGRHLVEVLLEAGADVHSKSPHGESCLHLLYSNNSNSHCAMSELHSTTKLLLGAGLELDINQVDVSGNSALHVLISQVNNMSVEVEDEQVLETVELLLNHNCDVHLVNQSGLTALLKLMLTFDFVVSNDSAGVTLETLPVRENYKVDLTVLQSAIALLLSAGASTNSVTTAGRCPLIMLLQNALSVPSSERKPLLDCLHTICRHGGRPSRSTVVHVSVVSSLARLAHHCLSLDNPLVKQDQAAFLSQIMTILLEFGLNVNHSTNLRRPIMEGSSGNLLLEMVRLIPYVRQSMDWHIVYDWVLLLLQWGANPDIEPYPGDSIICQSQSCIFLKAKGTQAVNRYMYEIQDFSHIFEDSHAFRLLLLFYHSMDHEALFQCMNTAKYMARFDPDRVPSSSFIRIITKLSSRPRSLKQNARVTIYKALGRQLKSRVPHLPLPVPLKNYLVDVE